MAAPAHAAPARLKESSLPHPAWINDIPLASADRKAGRGTPPRRASELPRARRTDTAARGRRGYGPRVAEALLITGGVLQLIGAALVLISIPIVRKHELGRSTPWERATAWMRRHLGLGKTVYARGAMSAASGFEVRAKVRPSPVDGTMTEQQRIERLEEYVERLDQDLDDAHRRISSKTRATETAAKAREQALRDEISQRGEQRREALQSSLRVQAAGGACIVIGLVLALLGIVL